MRKLIFLFLAIAVTAGFTVLKTDVYTVVVDAGHGGKDPGFEANDEVVEKDITLAVAKTLMELAQSKPGLKVILTREGDDFLSLQERVSTINEHDPDLVISLHADGYEERKASGITCYTSEGDFEDESRAIGKLFIDELHLLDGIETSEELYTQPLYILEESGSPGIMVSLGFLSDEDDRAYMSDPEKRGELCEKLIRALENAGK